MDWQRLSEVIEHTRTLSLPEADAYLRELDETAPDTAELARRFGERINLGASFMQTSCDPVAHIERRALTPGTKVGVWQILGMLGAGGMGEVYKADRADGLYQQTVALKVMQQGLDRDRQRFKRERERLAALDHPNISRIIDGGQTDDDRPFMAMEFVEGTPIDTFVEENGLPPETALRLFHEVCQAVRHAHGRLILHRDIKPDNVLIDTDGRVRLIDFGVGSLIDGDEDLSGGPLTLAYAAPEQLNGGPISVATDIFQLGMVLHRLLVGSPAERQPDGSVAIAQGPALSPELASIIGKALQTEPDRRFGSVDALADDIDCYLTHRPVASHRADTAYRLRKLVHRAPLAAGLLGALAIALVVGATVSLWFANNASREAERANAALVEAEHYLDRAERNGQVQKAYGDTLHRLFGDGNEEQVRALLLARSEEALALAGEDPTHAAEIIFAIGRNFVERNDYATATDVLGPWVERGFGDPRLLLDGKLNLALASQYSGDVERAVPLYEEVDRALGEGFDALSYERIVARAMLMTIKRDPEFTAEVEADLLAAAEKGGSVEEMVLYYFYLRSIASGRAEFGKAARYNERVVALMEENPLIEVAGRDMVLTMQAMYDMHVLDRPERARETLATVIGELDAIKGESLSRAHALDLLAYLDASDGNTGAALAKLEEAEDIVLRYSGPGSAAHATNTASFVNTLSMAGDTAAARAHLDRARRLAGAEKLAAATRVTLAEAHLVMVESSPQAASRFLRGKGLTRENAANHPMTNSWVEYLEGLGVTFASEAPGGT